MKRHTGGQATEEDKINEAKHRKAHVKIIKEPKAEPVDVKDEEMSQTTDEENSNPPDHLLKSVGLVSLDKSKKSATEIKPEVCWFRC